MVSSWLFSNQSNKRSQQASPACNSDHPPQKCRPAPNQSQFAQYRIANYFVMHVPRRNIAATQYIYPARCREVRKQAMMQHEDALQHPGVETIRLLFRALA
jgi:hypothetical protein